MKRKPSKSGFNKLLAADTTLLSAEPLIGLLELETDTGRIELAMNRILTEQLLFAIVEFLQAGKGDDAPTFAGRAFELGRGAKHLAALAQALARTRGALLRWGRQRPAETLIHRLRGARDAPQLKGRKLWAIKSRWESPQIRILATPS